MSNKEAYINDLEELEAAITILLAVPAGNSKKAVDSQKEAEKLAASAISLISCMKNDYIPVELN